MFTMLLANMQREAEIRQVAADSTTIAGMLAALYADPDEPHFEHLAFVPTAVELQQALERAVEAGYGSAASAIAAEIWRITSSAHEAPPAAIFGSKAGLWRLH